MAVDKKTLKLIADDLRFIAKRIESGDVRVIRFNKEQIIKRVGKNFIALGMVSSVGFAYRKGKVAGKVK